MRLLVLITLLLVASCASSTHTLSNKPPSLKVGAAALAGGAPETALSIARRQLALNRDDLPAILIEGQSLTELGELGQAEASFRHAIRLAPGSAAAKFGLGRVLLIKGDAVAAEAELGAVVAQSPDARALTDLGIARDMQDNHVLAREAYNTALRLAPELYAARVNLGLSFALSGDPAEAIMILQPLAVNPDAPKRVRHDLATALVLSGKQADAGRLLQRDLSTEQVSVAIAGYQQLSASR